jgi:hypothetical protein
LYDHLASERRPPVVVRTDATGACSRSRSAGEKTRAERPAQSSEAANRLALPPSIVAREPNVAWHAAQAAGCCGATVQAIKTAKFPSLGSDPFSAPRIRDKSKKSTSKKSKQRPKNAQISRSSLPQFSAPHRPPLRDRSTNQPTNQPTNMTSQPARPRSTIAYRPLAPPRLVFDS